VVYTLQEFLNRTKGVSYLLAVLILVAFIGFWLFLTGRERDE
jgi:hypothetical protein